MESLEEHRANHDYAALQLAEEIIKKNKGKKGFPVRYSYNSRKNDELNLSNGDVVVLYKVYPDGWAEGVSRRVGGPSMFPLSCLGGIVSRLLADPRFASRFFSSSGDPQMVQRRLNQTPVFMRPESMHATVIPVLPAASAHLQRAANHSRSNLHQEVKPETSSLDSVDSTSILQQQNLAVSYNPFKGSNLLNNASLRDKTNDADFPDLEFQPKSDASSVLNRYLPRQSVYSDVAPLPIHPS
jgi:hypothetical protein